MKKSIIPRKVSFKTDLLAPSALEALTIQILGASVVYSEPGLKLFHLDDGTLIEFYGPGSFPPEGMFDSGNMIVSFKVSDIEMSALTLADLGATVIDGITHSCSTHAYCHVKLKDETVIGLYQEN